MTFLWLFIANQFQFDGGQRTDSAIQLYRFLAAMVVPVVLDVSCDDILPLGSVWFKLMVVVTNSLTIQFPRFINQTRREVSMGLLKLYSSETQSGLDDLDLFSILTLCFV